MSKRAIVEVTDLKKIFKLPHDSKKSLKQAILSFGRTSYEYQKVLDGISFEVQQGEFFGVLGRNGSGKSTLLKLLAGIYQPTSGSLHVQGDLTPFIELGIGFNPELSGRDNVYLNGAILGLSRKEMDTKYDEIVRFAELERFMDQKLRNYSSGMLVRLAFSISIRAHNNILLIDEVLAVGDVNFQQKCLNVFRDLKKSGKTVILVTHDMNAVEEFCERALLIDEGRIVKIGKSKEIANLYRRLNFEQFSEETATEKSTRWGSGEVKIEDIQLFDGSNGVSKVYRSESLTLKLSLKGYSAVDNIIAGIQIRNSAGQILIATNTKQDGDTPIDIHEDEDMEIEWTIPNILKSGSYTITAAVHDYAGDPFDWHDEEFQFVVERGIETPALVDPSRKLVVRKAVKEK